MKKHEIIEELKKLKERVEQLEAEKKKQEQYRVPHIWKLTDPGKYISRFVDRGIECEGGCQIPTHYYSPDGKYPCIKCGRTLQYSFITYESQ